MQLEYFRMIDKVLSFDETAKSITCESVVPEVSPIFEGHFPGHPLMPGVLLLETMAQASGYLLLKLDDFSRMAFFIAADGLKLRQFVMPNERLDVTAVLEHKGSGYGVTRGAITRNGDKICEAQLKLRMMPYPHPDFESVMRGQAQRIGLLPG